MPADSLIDKFCLQIDRVVKTLLPTAAAFRRINPAALIPEARLTDTNKRQAAALMRVNHVGEVCAQALYQAQALTATQLPTRVQLQQAADEELDHLSWCHQRIIELGGHTSYLNPLWYAAAFSIGALAGAISDAWSLGFVAETEQQVVAHLQGHLQKLPLNDSKTRVILQQMAIEEAHHALTATTAGAVPLPLTVKLAMRFAAKTMTTIAYYL